MKRLLALLPPALILFAMTPTLPAAELGDPAAPLEIAEWIKGQPVDLAAVKGKKIVVVEFWATWCGPCRTSIPHLTELQKKFQDRGVIFIGVSDEKSAKVQPFVDQMGDKMDYTVALDKDRKTSEGYMGAYGINGIPHAFVVDKEGRIAWHGHPMAGLDKVLEKIAANKYDMATEKKRGTAQAKLQEYFELAGKGEEGEQLDKLGKEITALDKELGGIEPGEKLDLAEVRKMARFQNLMRDYQRALFTGKDDAELDSLEKKAQPYAPSGFNFAEFKGHFQLQRLFQDYYRAVTGSGSDAKVDELTKKLSALKSKNAEMLNEIAWTLLTDEKIKKRDLTLAMKLAKDAYDASEGKDANIADTYARGLFDSGKVAEAIEQQKKAIALCDDADRKKEFTETLKRYEKAGGAK